MKSYSLKSCISSDCVGVRLSGAMLVEELVSELNFNYLQKDLIPFVTCPFPEIVKLHKYAEFCK